MNIGNVSEFAFNKSGKLLAMVIDATDQAGNGILLRDMTTGPSARSRPTRRSTSG